MTGLNEKTAKLLRRYIAGNYQKAHSSERRLAYLGWSRDLMSEPGQVDCVSPTVTR